MDEAAINARHIPITADGALYRAAHHAWSARISLLQAIPFLQAQHKDHRQSGELGCVGYDQISLPPTLEL